MAKVLREGKFIRDSVVRLSHQLVEKLTALQEEDLEEAIWNLLEARMTLNIKADNVLTKDYFDIRINQLIEHK